MQTAEMIDTAKITFLPMGSSIPEWLLAADPKQAGAPKGAWRFDCDVQIIELRDDFVVFPVLPFDRPANCHVLDFTGMAEHHVYPPTKPVRVIHMIQTYFPIEYAPQVHAAQERLRAAQLQPGPWQVGHPTPPVERPGLVVRWWRALFGRGGQPVS